MYVSIVQVQYRELHEFMTGVGKGEEEKGFFPRISHFFIYIYIFLISPATPLYCTSTYQVRKS